MSRVSTKGLQDQFELSDDMATKINIQFYSDTPDALLKALVE